MLTNSLFHSQQHILLPPASLLNRDDKPDAQPQSDPSALSLDFPDADIADIDMFLRSEPLIPTPPPDTNQPFDVDSFLNFDTIDEQALAEAFSPLPDFQHIFTPPPDPVHTEAPSHDLRQPDPFELNEGLAPAFDWLVGESFPQPQLAMPVAKRPALLSWMSDSQPSSPFYAAANDETRAMLPLPEQMAQHSPLEPGYLLPFPLPGNEINLPAPVAASSVPQQTSSHKAHPPVDHLPVQVHNPFKSNAKRKRDEREESVSTTSDDVKPKPKRPRDTQSQLELKKIMIGYEYTQNPSLQPGELAKKYKVSSRKVRGWLGLDGNKQ